MLEQREREDTSDSTVPGAVPDISVRRQLASNASQHPATILPLGIAALAAIHLTLLSPAVGGGTWAAAVLGISGGLALANFVYRYHRDRDRTANSLQSRLQFEISRIQDSNLQQESHTVQAGLVEVGLTQGSSVLRRLSNEYDRLREASRSSDESPLSAPHITSLVDETYRRGLSVLGSAVELARAISAPSRSEVEQDVTRLETEISAALTSDQSPERLLLKEETLAMQKRQLQELDRMQLHIEELLFQARRCELSLNHARIELAAIKTGSSHSGLNTVIEALEGTVRRAKEVQEELKNLGY